MVLLDLSHPRKKLSEQIEKLRFNLKFERMHSGGYIIAAGVLPLLLLMSASTALALGGDTTENVHLSGNYIERVGYPVVFALLETMKQGWYYQYKAIKDCFILSKL